MTWMLKVHDDLDAGFDLDDDLIPQFKSSCTLSPGSCTLSPRLDLDDDSDRSI